MPCTALRLVDVAVIDDDEPRILDLRIAERLGFTEPRAIRKLIRRHKGELGRHGGLGQHVPNPGPQGGRPSREYWLNEAQAILICMKSETPLAEDIRAEIVTVFQAYRHGRLVPASPLTADVIGAVFDQRLAPVHRKLDEHSLIIKEIGGNVVRVERRLDDIVPRREFSARSERQFIETVRQQYGGCCPLNRKVRIVNEDGSRTEELHIDHFNGRELTGIDDGWAISRGAHERIHKDAEYKNKARPHFTVFHDNRRELFSHAGSAKTRCKGSIPDDRQRPLL